jgi:hypothetical protein
MNKIILTIYLLLIFISCTDEEIKFEAFNPEAFAFDLGESWEVNATINIKGFYQKESDGNHSASIKYSADLTLPSGEVKKNVYQNNEKFTGGEVISDIQLEIQFELNSTYAEGKYKLLIYIEDNYSDKKTERPVQFELSE